MRCLAGLLYFCNMLNTKNPQISNKMLDAAREAMDDLIEGASEMHRATAFLVSLHEEKEFPINIQTMSEISQMMLSMRKMLFEQQAELELNLACIDDERMVNDMLSSIDKKSETGRADAQ